MEPAPSRNFGTNQTQFKILRVEFILRVEVFSQILNNKMKFVILLVVLVAVELASTEKYSAKEKKAIKYMAQYGYLPDRYVLI